MTAHPEAARGGLVVGIRGRLATDAMLRNSLAIMATSVVTSLFGYVFWLVVAHVTTAAVTGAGAAATSALQAAATVAAVGAAAAMVEWLPRCTSEAEWRARVTVGLLVATVGSAVGGTVAVLVLGTLAGTLPALATPAGGAVFVAGTVFFAVGATVDYIAVAERRGALMLARNTLFVVARIPLLFLPWLLPGTGDQILTSWALAGAVSLLVGVVGFRGRPLRLARRGLVPYWREMRTSLVGQHLVTITAMLGGYLLPIVVVARVSAEANAYFYATWMLGAIFFMISPAVSTSLFAEVASDPSMALATARRGAKIIGALLVVPMAVYLVGGGLLLRLFGPDYPDHGRLLLVVLTLSAVPDAVTNLAVTVLRATGRMPTALWLNTAMLVGGLALTWVLLPGMGIVAAGVGWLAAQTAGALWVLVAWRRRG
jgi:O-antigen/teichoic acid export membrane protein